jgi:hypothetical protein
MPTSLDLEYNGCRWTAATGWVHCHLKRRYGILGVSLERPTWRPAHFSALVLGCGIGGDFGGDRREVFPCGQPIDDFLRLLLRRNLDVTNAHLLVADRDGRAKVLSDLLLQQLRFNDLAVLVRRQTAIVNGIPVGVGESLGVPGLRS